jgi:hypothetical protein
MASLLRSKVFRYSLAAVCVVLVIGTLPSVYLIAAGLAGGGAGTATAYFAGKLAAYVLEIVVLSYLAWRLVKGSATKASSSNVVPNA